MQPAAAHNTTYSNNQADGGNIIYGSVNGNVHFPSNADSSVGPTAHQCLRDLRVTDPREDRARIEGDKDKLLKDCYEWILYNDSFKQWRSQNGPQLLWVRGDPGKGKTMMMMGLIAELSQRPQAQSPSKTMSKMLFKLKLKFQPCLLAYFFCQNTHPELNNAISVLRGLIYMIVDQKEQLMRHVEKPYKAVGRAIFEGPNALYALKDILSNILNDPILPTTYLLVDALDECASDLSALLRIVTDDSFSQQSKVKWLVTSRNVPEIEQYLQPDSTGIKVSLEVNSSHVSKAVAAFVNFKVRLLATAMNYNSKLEANVQQMLLNRAEGTFLWVSLVCKELEGLPLYRTQEALDAMPTGLDPLYNRMMTQILTQKDTTTAEYCKAVLRSLATAFRPLHLLELAVSAALPGDQFDNTQVVANLVSHCGSFLTVRHDTVSFIHLSAKDYFTSGKGRELFESATAEYHGRVMYRLLNIMRGTLRRDMCDLEKLGARTADVVEQKKNSALVKVAYACEYWIDHLCNFKLTPSASYNDAMCAGGIVDMFLREKFVYWLEALSLHKSLSKGVAAIDKLWTLVQRMGEANTFASLVKDAHRFVMYHKGAIEDSASQVYASALLFSPKKSLIRNVFKHEELDRITIMPVMSDDWNLCLQTLEGHSNRVNSVAFSHDSTRLASASTDSTVKIWDASSGACLKTLEGHSSWVNSVAFSHDSTRLASTSNDSTVKIWDANSGACLQTLEDPSNWVYVVAFSHDSTRLASASTDSTVKIWDASSGACLQKLEGHSKLVNSLAFSHDSSWLASPSGNSTVKIWDASSGACLQTLEGHSSLVYSVAFSHGSAWLVSASDDRTIKIWDASSGVCLQTLEGHSNSVRSVALSHDSTRLVSASDDRTIKIWDASSGTRLQTLKGHSNWVNSVVFSHDSSWLASASGDRTVKVWDATSGACLQTLEGHSKSVKSIAFSHDSTRLASASTDSTVKIWDASSGACLKTLEGHSNSVNSVVFSHDSTRLASASADSTVKIWDASSGACLQTLEDHSNLVNSLAFSHDSTRLASASGDRTVKIWDASSGACLQTLKGHSSWVNSATFSHDSSWVVSASGDSTVKIWSASSGACLQTLVVHSNSVNSVAFSHDSTRLVSASGDMTIKIWDASSGAYLQTLEGHSNSVNSLTFSHDSARLASTSADSTVKIWDATNGACLQTLEGHSKSANSVAFSHDSSWLASASGDRTVKIWDASSGACLQTLKGHSSWVYSVVFSHNSTLLASASLDRTVKVWDASSGACLQTLEGHSDLVNSVVFSHDSSRVMSTSDDSTVKIWDANSGACLQTLEGHSDSKFTFVFDLQDSNKVEHTREQPLHQDISISIDKFWMSVGSQTLLWLPSEYRPTCTAVSGRHIGVGTGNGKVWIGRVK